MFTIGRLWRRKCLRDISPASGDERLDQSSGTILDSGSAVQTSIAEVLDPILSRRNSSSEIRQHRTRPEEMNDRPTKCFYVQPCFGPHHNPQDIFYREVYVRQFTVEGFIHPLAEKCGVARRQIVQVSRVSTYEDQLSFDDNAVKDLADGQDMIAQLEEVEASLAGADAFSCLDGRGVKEEAHAVSRYYKVQLIY